MKITDIKYVESIDKNKDVRISCVDFGVVNNNGNFITFRRNDILLEEIPHIKKELEAMLVYWSGGIF
jgi:hypothetical protein